MMAINKRLSLRGCWRMVNAIQNGDTPKEIRQRAWIAAEWLKANEVISIDDFDELMDTVAFWVRASYNPEAYGIVWND